MSNIKPAAYGMEPDQHLVKGEMVGQKAKGEMSTVESVACERSKGPGDQAQRSGSWNGSDTPKNTAARNK